MAYYTRDGAIKVCANYSEQRRQLAALYPMITKVFKEFDGKVYNVRLERALKEAVKPAYIYCTKRCNFIEISAKIGHGNNFLTVAQIHNDDLIDGKRIPAEKLIESARIKREHFLQEAAEMDLFVANMDTIKAQLETVKKTYNGILDGLPYMARDILNAQRMY